MFKTRMTEVLNIKHPIMLAGMNWITEPKLVSAVCNAGGLGIFATAHCAPGETRKSIEEIKKLTDRPFGINQTLNGPGAKENIETAIAEKVPVINYSLGKPWFVDQVHSYGGKVIGTVATAKHAVKAQEMGCDALVVTGHEAAAHGDVATSLVLIPVVASQVKLPVIAAGGFYNGKGLAAALALGAEGISMGTRFAITQESMVHNNYKQLCLRATEQDTLYSNVFDGMKGRVLKTNGAEKMMKGISFREAVGAAREVKQQLNLSTWQFLKLSIQMMRSEEGSPLWVQAQMAAGNQRHMKAIYQGNMEEGILFAGQDVGGIKDVPTVLQLIERIVLEAENTIDSLQHKRS
jgi:enoyl-[acyl-carrier protein] reductase II